MSKFSTSALLLKKTPYSETSLILKCLTEKEGVQSFMFAGAQRKGKKGNILQSLSWIEIEGYQRADSTLGKITDVSFVKQWNLIPSDVYRSTIVMFVAEVINKISTENTEEHRLYDFLCQFLQRLDQEPFPQEAHLYFLVEIIHYLGISPLDINLEKAKYYDYLEGAFSVHQPPHHVFEEGNHVQMLQKVFGKTDIEDKSFVNGKERMEVMQLLLRYLKVHFDVLDDLNTLDVVVTIFD